MKKKIIVMLLLVAMIPAMLFANDLLQMGLNIGYKPTLNELQTEAPADWKDYFKPDYFTFAPELKINLFFVDLDATAFFNFSEQGVLIDTQLAADLYAKLFGVLKLSAGAGINMPFYYDKASSAWYLYAQGADGADLPLADIDAADTFMNSYLAYRAGVGFDFGTFNMMINYSVPTTGTFADPDFMPNWDHGQFSLGLLFDLF